MNCKDCPHLIKMESAEIAKWWDLYCAKHDMRHCPIPKENLKYLVCMEEERRRKRD